MHATDNGNDKVCIRTDFAQVNTVADRCAEVIIRFAEIRSTVVARWIVDLEIRRINHCLERRRLSLPSGFHRVESIVDY